MITTIFSITTNRFSMRLCLTRLSKKKKRRFSMWLCLTRLPHVASFYSVTTACFPDKVVSAWLHRLMDLYSTRSSINRIQSSSTEITKFLSARNIEYYGYETVCLSLSHPPCGCGSRHYTITNLYDHRILHPLLHVTSRNYLPNSVHLHPFTSPSLHHSPRTFSLHHSPRTFITRLNTPISISSASS